MRRDDRGESLIELLIALSIMGTAVVALAAGLVTSVTVSDIHRKQATAQQYVRGYAEAIENTVAGGGYVGCATTASYASPNGFSVPTGYTKSVAAVKYWTGSAWSTSCGTDSGLQQVTTVVSSVDGRASERLVVVVRKPCGPGSSCT